MEDEVMTVADVAIYLKVSEQIARRLDIPHTRQGRIIRYQKRDVIAWMNEHKVKKEESGERERVSEDCSTIGA